MAFANVNISDILATTIENRSRKIADNVTNNNYLLKKLSMKGKIKPFSGGHKILQELSFAENSNAGWYSGYDLLPVGVSDVISAAEYNIKQAAVPVIISGLEQLQNAGREQMIDLMQGRLEVAESTMANMITQGIYSNGFVQIVLNFFTLWILLSYLVPISLFVTLEIVKFWQGFIFINFDKMMKNPKKYQPSVMHD